MSTYISPRKPNPTFDDVPFWLASYLNHLRTILSYTPKTLVTSYSALREYCRYIVFKKRFGHEPSKDRKLELNGDLCDEMEILQDLSIMNLSLDTVAGMTRKEIEQYHYFLADVRGNQPVTRNKKLAVLRSFYNYIVDQQEDLRDVYFPYESESFRALNCLHLELAVSPAAKIISAKQPKKEPVFLKKEEVERLLRCVEGPNDVRDYAIILLFLVTGLRLKELCAINMKDLSEDSIYIMGKGMKERTVCLTESCKNALDEYIREYRDPIADKLLEKNALFVSSRRLRRLTERAVQGMVEKRLAAAGLSYASVHKLRHTAATMLVEEGTDLLTVQKYLGHDSPETTAKYTHLSNAAVRDAVMHTTLGSLGDEGLRRKTVVEEDE